MKIKKWYIPAGVGLIFEAVALILWQTKDNLFYLFNFSYIGTAIAIELLLFQMEYKHARRIVQLLVGLYMLVYLGLICNENMQIEGFWYYLFEAASAYLRKRMVRICLLDCYGFRFPPIQASKGPP